MWLLPWRKKDRITKPKEAEVVYICKEVQQVGHKLEGSLNRLDGLITMINNRDKVSVWHSSSQLGNTEA